MASIKFDYGSTQLEFRPSLEKHLQAEWAEVIDPSWLAEGGLEDNTHMTVYYGFEEIDATKVETIVSHLPPLAVEIEGIDSFPAGKFGVPIFLKVKLTPQLQKLRDDIHTCGQFIPNAFPGLQAAHHYRVC